MHFKDLYISRFRELLGKERGILLNRERGNISEILLCPYCLRFKFIFDENTKEYVCPNCKHITSKEDYKKFAQIQNLSGLLFDFNQGKSGDGQKVFDHHGFYQAGILMTATQRVIEFFELISSFLINQGNIKEFRERPDLNQIIEKNGFLIIKKALKALDIKIGSLNKLNLYTNHIDVDSVLSVFAFRNPIFAMKNRDLLINLSRFNDLMLLNKSVKDYYLIFYGIETDLREKGKRNIEIFDYFLVNLKDIFENKHKYLVFAKSEQDLIKKNLDILDNVDKSDFLKILEGFREKVLEFKTPIGFREPIALFEFIGKEENREFNLPFILKKGVKKEIFSLSINANVEGFEKLNLNDLKDYLYKAEKEKILKIVKENKEIILKKREYKRKLEELNQELIEHKKLNWFSNLRTLVQKDQFDEFYDIIKNNESIFDYNYDSLKTTYYQLMNCIDEITMGEERKLSKKEKKTINRIKSLMLKELTEVIDELGNHYMKDKKKYIDYLNNANISRFYSDVEKIWILKPNIIMTNGGYPSNLTYEEFVEVLRFCLNKEFNLKSF